MLIVCAFNRINYSVPNGEKTWSNAKQSITIARDSE
jgi:hypothetical protein